MGLSQMKYCMDGAIATSHDVFFLNLQVKLGAMCRLHIKEQPLQDIGFQLLHIEPIMFHAHTQYLFELWIHFVRIICFPPSSPISLEIVS